ncbi:MAG: gamma-glutamyl-gamma-aminobutyrate hydrolase family protein [Oscillospiraceae bacterium]
MKPIIGIPAYFFASSKPTLYGTNSAYVEAVERAGGQPLLLPIDAQTSQCERLVQMLDGLLLPGGPDVSPLMFGEQPIACVTLTKQENDRYEIALVHAACMLKKPILGICRGQQVLNVALGGNLYQDIPTQYKNEICHKQDMSIRGEPTHTVRIAPHTRLAEALGALKLEVNSYHHQSVQRVAEGLRISAVAEDGVIEAVESDDGLLLGVQWHPELLAPHFETAARLFEMFVKRCSKD